MAKLPQRYEPPASVLVKPERSRAAEWVALVGALLIMSARASSTRSGGMDQVDRAPQVLRGGEYPNNNSRHQDSRVKMTSFRSRLMDGIFRALNNSGQVRRVPLRYARRARQHGLAFNSRLMSALKSCRVQISDSRADREGGVSRTATAPTANPPVVNTGTPDVEANSARATGDEKRRPANLRSAWWHNRVSPGLRGSRWCVSRRRPSERVGVCWRP